MDDADAEWDSGPFCQHWGDPAECDEVCRRCKRFCCEHYNDGGERAGLEWKGNDCIGWVGDA